MKASKIGVIGCGNIAQVYLNDFKQIYGKQIEVIACADIIPEKAKETAEIFNISRACTVEEILAIPEIEIILNLTVPAAHTQINKLALQAGKHVYCEKPLALSMEDAKEVLDIANRKGLRIGCAPDTFMGPAIQTSRKLLDEGWIGKPFAAVTNIIGWGPETWHPNPDFFYKPGGGPLMDMGPYAIAALIALFGPMKKLQCFAGKALDTRTIYSQPHRNETIDVEVFTHYSGTAEMQNGIIVDMNMSFDIWKSNLPVFEVYGTEGMLSIPHPADFSGSIRLYRNNGIIDELEGRGVVETKNNDYAIPQVYSGSVGNRRGLGIVDMAAAITLGRKHRTNEQFVLHNTEVLLAFDKSAKDNSVYMMQTTCDRPEPLPAGSRIACVD